MFNYLVTSSLKHRLLVLAGAFFLLAYGLWTARQLPVDVFPDLNKPTVTLITEAPGMAPEEVELLVTFPLEAALNGTPDMTRIRSTSAVGLSLIYLEFEWGTDIYRNRQLVTEQLGLVKSQLPEDVSPQMGPISSVMGEIMMLALSSETMTPMELRELADWVIRPRLMGVPGVSQIIPIGGEVRQYQVKPNPVALYQLGITADDLRLALSGFASNSGGGFIDQNAREFMIRNIGRSTRIEDLRQLVVGQGLRGPILLHQVATVEFAARPRRGDAGYMGGAAVIMSVQKQPGADTLALTASIETALATMRPNLPEGVNIDDNLFRQSSYINASISTLSTTLIEASVMVAIVLLLFMMNGRTTLISLTAIPVSLCITLLVFRWFGMTINTMTLGGIAIAIGELVDDAVVDVENIHRRLKQSAERLKPLAAIRIVTAASIEVRSSIVYSTLIVILVFLPLFALPGIEGRLFTPLGISYVVAIVASLATSLTLTPVLCYFLLPKMRERHKQGAPVAEALKRYNRRCVGWALDNPGPLIGSVVAMVVIAGVAAMQLPRIFLPPFNEGTVTVILVSNPGISLGQSNRLGQAAEQLLLEVPEVVKVGRRTGRAELDEHAEDVNVSEIEVQLRNEDRTTEDVIQDIRTKLAGLPVSIEIGQPMSHRIDVMMTGVRGAVAIKLFGDDLDKLRFLAASLETRVATIPGITDLKMEKQVRIPQLRVEVDYDAAAQYGVLPSHVTATLEWLTHGAVVSQVIDGARRFEVVMRLDDLDRTSWGLNELLIESPRGPIPLAAVARIEETDGPNKISHEDGRRRIAVTANVVAGADLGAIADAVRREIAALELPSGYFVSLEGSSQAQAESQVLMLILTAAALTLIFLVLFVRYRSVALALIIISNVPLALIGSVIALWVAGLPLSVASMVGFITMTGISTRNGILKISHYLNLAKNEGEVFGRKQILRGSDERLTPVLMTALSAALALIPLLLDGTAPGKEVLYPVAVTIFGGLVSSTILDALLTPVLFHLFGRKAQARLMRQDGSEDVLGKIKEAY